MKKFLFAVAATVALLAFAGGAQAQNANPFEGPRKPIFKSLFHKQPLPAFQAAPWYLYFPYDAHFQTASPMYNSPFYAPPGSGGGFQANPYFSQPGHMMPPLVPPAPTPMPVPVPVK